MIKLIALLAVLTADFSECAFCPDPKKYIVPVTTFYPTVTAVWTVENAANFTTSFACRHQSDIQMFEAVHDVECIDKRPTGVYPIPYCGKPR